MKKRKSFISRPLDIIFSAPSHIAVLRALKNVREGLSGREVARRAGVNHQTSADSLARLEARGIVLRLGSGRSQLFRLNRRNNLVRTVILPMFEAEHKQFMRIQEDLARVIRGNCLSAVLFGSAAREEETADSDLDIALIVEKKNPGLYEISRKLISRGMERWGLRISPIIIPRTEFIKRAEREEPLITDLLQEGITIFGKPLRNLLK